MFRAREKKSLSQLTDSRSLRKKKREFNWDWTCGCRSEIMEDLFVNCFCLAALTRPPVHHVWLWGEKQISSWIFHDFLFRFWFVREHFWSAPKIELPLVQWTVDVTLTVLSPFYRRFGWLICHDTVWRSLPVEHYELLMFFFWQIIKNFAAIFPEIFSSFLLLCD